MAVSLRVSQWSDVALLQERTLGVPAALTLATIEVESSGEPRAMRAEPKINDASRGLMQLLLGTARELGYTGPPGAPAELTGLFDPTTNVHLGALLLQSLQNRFGGDVARIASAYNGGDRAALGFGTPVTKQTTVCLERNAAGDCVRTFTAQPGQFGNQPHVTKVLEAFARWRDYLESAAPSPGVDAPPAPSAPIAPAPVRPGCLPIVLGAVALAVGSSLL